LKPQNAHLIESYCGLIAVYVEGAMNESNVRKWFQKFKEDRTSIHDEK
jgi:hypothetical protein